MTLPDHPLRLLAAPLLFGLLWGCGAEQTSDLGEWSLRRNGLTLTEDLRVSETEAFYFGRITDLDVTSQGRIVVADQEATNIKVLEPDGALIDTLGREGEGPGEFQRLRSVQVARGDSIYAYDLQRSRLTVFSPPPSLKPARTLTISREQGTAFEVAVLGDRLAGTFSEVGEPDDGVGRPTPNPWRWIDASGMPADTLMSTRSQKRAVKSINEYLRVQPIPFSRETVTAVGPSTRLYYGSTDSLHVAAHLPNGTSEVVASVPTEPIPVREADRDSALSDVESDVPVLRDANAAMKEMVTSALPDTKPAFTDLLVADDGRLWIERPTPTTEADTTSWWILNPSSKAIQEVRLPAEVNLEVVQNGMVYGTITAENGAPAVVQYHIQTQAK